MTEKNLKKKKAKANRVWFDMDLGTKTHADKKHPSRNKEKRKLKKILDKIDY